MREEGEEMSVERGEWYVEMVGECWRKLVSV